MGCTLSVSRSRVIGRPSATPRSADRFQLKLLLHRYGGRFLTLAGGRSGAFPDVDRQQDHRDHKRQRVQQDSVVGPFDAILADLKRRTQGSQ